MDASADRSNTSALLDQLLARLEPAAKALAPEPPSVQELAELWQQAQLALDEGRSDAVALWSDLAVYMPGQAGAQFGLALSLQQEGQTEMAGRHFSYAYALDPSDAATAFRLGECLLALGYPNDAREALLAAQQLCELPHNRPEIGQMAEQLMQSL